MESEAIKLDRFAKKAERVFQKMEWTYKTGPQGEYVPDRRDITSICLDGQKTIRAYLENHTTKDSSMYEAGRIYMRGWRDRDGEILFNYYLDPLDGMDHIRGEA